MKNWSLPALSIIIALMASCITKTPPDDSWVSFTTPEKEGMIADSLKSIDPLLTVMIDSSKIPGAAVLIARNGKIIYHKALGFQDIEEGLPLDTNDIFRIASMTKPLVSVAIMQLWEKGKLDLNDPVSKFITSFSDQQIMDTYDATDTTWTSRPAKREITIHHLLTHTSGIGYSFASRSLSPIYAKYEIPDLANPADITIEEVTNKLGSLPLLFDPGSKYMYGLSTDVLGRVIEAVSGLTLGEYIEHNITQPLKMDDTKFFYEEAFSDRLTTVYSVNPRTGKIFSSRATGGSASVDYPIEGSKKYFSGGSGLCSTTIDYFIFCQTILNGGIYKGIRILNEETVAFMLSDQLDSLRSSDISTFGYGFQINRERNDDGTPGRIIRLGWSGAFNTWFNINPSENTVEIIMSQVIFNPYNQEIISKFTGSIANSFIQ